MVTFRRKPVLLILLLIAGPAVALAQGNRLCDRRTLSKHDTVSVLAAARVATEGKLPDFHVEDICVVKSWAHVSVSSLPRNDPDGTRHTWDMQCVGQPRTWFKRGGGWDCDAPTMTREMDAKIMFRGKERALLISLDPTSTSELAVRLTERALALFDSKSSVLGECGVTDDPKREAEWRKIQKDFSPAADRPEFDVDIERDPEGSLSVSPFTGLNFSFPPSAAADLDGAQVCWFLTIIIT